ncbi:hypothetical protein F0919_02565 [Taibaiella lutea]|uniref:Outer membrane protein beta-barrel domain-containing protein n=1 Tax=Taibaiella lutea TaxID=2608001 RepID=A0A5M6CMY6_9BACT|nr:DUF6048 family protein [Taibaiella lutea]KAA5536571.1 hypothetical protein F0919_02565 [Taibaiella lutea]
MKKHIALLLLSVLSFSKMTAQSNGGVTLPGNELNNIDSSKIGKVDSLIINKTDSSTTAKKKEPKPPYVHQFRIGIDVARLATNFIYKDKKGYEMQFDYLLRSKNYAVFEAGFGKNAVDYTNLKYDNTGAFFKIGIDKNVIDIVNDHDYDIFFIGIRYGMGFGKRSDATFLVPSYFGSPSEGTSPEESYFIHWLELNLGLRVEIFKQVFVGWNARIKFLLNSGEFQQLAPSYVPGYGAGDKSTVAGGNFYINYAIRWGGK